MRKTLLAAAVAMLALVVNSEWAEADIVGWWTVTGSVGVAVEIDGEVVILDGPSTFVDYFRFKRDRTGRFLTGDDLIGGLQGTWKKKPNTARKYVVQLNRAQVKASFEFYFESLVGANVGVTITTAKITAKESLGGTLRGNIVIAGAVAGPGGVVPFVALTPGYFGAKGIHSPFSAAEEEDEKSGSFVHAVAGALQRVLQPR